MKQYIKFSPLLFLALWASVSIAQTPTAGLNSVTTARARVATTNPAELSDPKKADIAVRYTDGSGRPVQTVHYGASPTGMDIISGHNTLDALGRPDKSYLSAPSPASTGMYQHAAATLASGFHADTKPYAQITQYQASPLSVPLESVGPGQAFTNKGKLESYKTAGAGIRKYTAPLVEYPASSGHYASGGTVVLEGTFSNGDLMEYHYTDEDGNETIEYKGGISGLLYESHQKDKGSSNVLKTTYIYDGADRLAYVLPPRASSAVSGGSGTVMDESETLFLEGIYATHYNKWGLPGESHKPGGGWTYTIYNELGQAVMGQDPRQRMSNTWEWVKYDGHGRTVMTGTITKSSTLESTQNSFFDQGAAQQFEERSTAAGNLHGYSNTSFPSGWNPSSSDVKAVYYYDAYAWVNNVNLHFSPYKTPRWGNATGLATGSMVRRLDNGSFLKSVSYYDDKNRVIQTKTENRFGGVNQSDFVYNFIGELLEERTIYRKPGQADIEVKTSYERDHRGRVLGATHYLNGVATPLAQYKYDGIGRLVQKNLMAAAHDIITEDDAQPNGDQDLANRYVLLQPGAISAENGTYLAGVLPSALQKIDYVYDIRGQLRGINTGANGNISLQDGDVFGLKLDHHETGATYNGKLARQTWQTPARGSQWAGGSPHPGQRSQTYSYDGYDRLSGAVYSGAIGENYTVSPVHYDFQGNITVLSRNGPTGQGTWGAVDNLFYSYASGGNRLLGIYDHGANPGGFRDRPGGTSGDTDYTYWPDGSLKSDANKGITLIEYNYLGLPEKTHWGASIRIENNYDAEGLLLSRKFVNGGTITQTDYMGGLIYENGVLKSILHDEGRVKIENGLLSLPKYQFFITDHLGNTRSIVERVDDSTALVQEVHYYPYGAVMEGIGITGDWDFLYQGKEFLDFNGANLYDFNTRSYDAYIGRFWQLDGANQFASGYTGMGNMPTVGVDPDGQFVHIIIGAAIGGVVNLGIKAFQGKINSWGDGFAAFGIGAAAGGVGAATGGAAFLAAGGGAAGAGGFIAGAVGGAAGAAVSSPIQGLGNAAYFGDPYSLKSFGRDIAFGALGGGIVNGAIAGFNKTPSGAFRNVWNGDRVANGASRFSLRNGSLLRQQGWTKGIGGRWTSVGGGNTTSQFPDWVDDLGNVHQGGTYTSQAPNNSIATYYPANNGAVGNWTSTFLRPGQIIDRYGGPGRFFASAETKAGARSLPYNTNRDLYTKYEVLKPFKVQTSTIAPAFGEIGGGTQYLSPVTSDVLIKRGIIRAIR